LSTSCDVAISVVDVVIGDVAVVVVVVVAAAAAAVARQPDE